MKVPVSGALEQGMAPAIGYAMPWACSLLSYAGMHADKISPVTVSHKLKHLAP